MRALVFCEHHEGALTRGARSGLLRKARRRSAPRFRVVVAGSGCARASAEEAGAHGASTLWVADDERLAAPLPQPRVDVLAALVRDEGFDTVLFAQSVLAADIAAGLAARLGAGLNWDLVDLAVDGTGKRAALADSVFVDVGWVGERAHRQSSARSVFDAAPTQAGTADVEGTRRSSSRTSRRSRR